MRICVIGTVGVPACYGGFETLVENLIAENGKEFVVFCSGRFYTERLMVYRGAQLVYIPINANGFQSVLYDSVSILISVLRGHRKLLILGVSGAIILPFVRFFCQNLHLVVNIDGLEWRRNKWGKFAQRFLKLSEKIAVNYSNIVISDNQAIADYVLEEYDIASHVIAYGGDNPKIRIDHARLRRDYALALCRIEPENNVHIILEAFSVINKKIRFIGNWDNSEYGRSLRSKYASFPNIVLLNPVYDQAELHSIRSGCDVYIHGHSAGGTNPSLVEMMHYAVPIYAFDCAFNHATLDNLGVYFNSVEALTRILSNDLVASAGLPLLEVAQKKYTWEIVSKQYLSLFPD